MIDYIGKTVAFFGKKGKGKTASMTALAVDNLRGEAAKQRLAACRAAIAEFNSQGSSYMPPSTPPVYSNYPISVSTGYKQIISSFYVDPFRLGFENDDVDVINVPPHSLIAITEIQKVVNSRKSATYPDWASRWQEESRHFDVTMLYDLQRITLVDLNLREITDYFIQPVDMEHIRDGIGNITKTVFTWHIFEEWEHIELSKKGEGGLFKKEKYTFEGNIFKCYNNQEFRKHFLPREGKNFDYIPHLSLSTNPEDLKKYNEMYKPVSQKMFYGKGKQKQ